jgi:hypothetical protein
VKYYAFKANLLKIRKATLNKILKNKKTVAGFGEKKQALRLEIKFPLNAKLKFFDALQLNFNKPFILIHCDLIKVLFYDIDWLKKRGCGVTVFYLKYLPATATFK